MIAPYPFAVPLADQARIERHWAYIARVWHSDPIRALVLRDLLIATYCYDSIAAGDVLLAVDSQLHPIPTSSA